ncbi:MFS general substrate transporter [Hypoxylon sp. FL1857]|nr:MFS general substrate transporter [Hypoxylon sp. FL1857]
MAASEVPPGMANDNPEEATPESKEAISQLNQTGLQPEITFTPPSGTAETNSQSNLPETRLPEANFRRLIRPCECGDRIGFRWPLWKKWLYLCVIFLVQLSMNLNTTLYSNAIDGISLEYGVTPFLIRWGGAASFLITYAFGCELWAPWSEEFGRKPVLQSSLGLVNCFAILVATSPNWAGHVIGRVLGGLSSAGGSVTLAIISDMFEPDDPMFQHATSFIVFSSVYGSIIGPIIGGFVQKYLAWRWCIWIQVIFGVFVQLLHFFIVPETRASIIMDRVAKEYRKSGKNSQVFGPSEMANRRIDWVDVGKIWMRPFRMFMTEPIVLAFSLLSGFSDALIFMMVQSFGFVYWQYGFNSIQIGLSFLPIGLGYMFAYVIFFLFILRNVSLRAKRPHDEFAQYESRLTPLLWMAPLLPIGLLVFAFTAASSTTPIHWAPSMVGSFLIGIANYAIYMATIDYVLRAYGPFAASATGGNGWARDFLAGVLTPYAIPMVRYRYEKLSVFMATIVLVAIAIVLCGAVFLVYKYGPWLRHHSKFAQTLAKAEADQGVVIVDSGNEIADIASHGMNHAANFSLSESTRGRQRNALEPNTLSELPRTSLQLERSPVWYQHHRCQSLPARPSPSPLNPNQSQESQRNQGMTRDAENITTNSGKSCTCSSQQTLTGTCSFCKPAESIRIGDNYAPTSLQEVENANSEPINEVGMEESAVPSPTTHIGAGSEPSEPGAFSQGNEMSDGKSHCGMM